MALCAAQVIDAYAARLAATGRPVFTSRLWPLAESDLPAWRVTGEGEDIIRDGFTDGIHEHRLALQFKAYARATSDIDDALHALASTGLTAIFAQPLPYDLAFTGIDRNTAVEAVGESSMSSIALLATATFFARPQAPDTFI
jgi:hypothetical protein